MSLIGKRVVVIGGTSGIGLATARAFLSSSASVIIGSRSSAKISEAIRALPGPVDGYTVDFRMDNELEGFFATVGAFDHLVVTAGQAAMGPFDTLPMDQALAAFDSKFWGQYRTLKAALPYLNPQSSVTFTSGVYALHPPKGGFVLAAINSGLEGLVRGLAVDLAPIRVNAVSPGIVDTPIYARLSEQDRQALWQDLSQRLPVGHVGTAEALAECYVFLAQNDFSTGTVLLVDGGAHLGSA